VVESWPPENKTSAVVCMMEGFYTAQ
jgi:hypothetical protein